MIKWNKIIPSRTKAFDFLFNSRKKFNISMWKRISWSLQANSQEYRFFWSSTTAFSKSLKCVLRRQAERNSNFFSLSVWHGVRTWHTCWWLGSETGDSISYNPLLLFLHRKVQFSRNFSKRTCIMYWVTKNILRINLQTLTIESLFHFRHCIANCDQTFQTQNDRIRTMQKVNSLA